MLAYMHDRQGEGKERKGKREGTCMIERKERQGRREGGTDGCVIGVGRSMDK